MRDSAYNYELTESGALPEGWKAVRLGMQRTQGAAILQEDVLLRLRTRMTRIGRIFTDNFNPCASVSSVQSVFYRHPAVIDENNKPQMNADERRYILATGFADFFAGRGFFVTECGRTTHRKGRKERKAVQKEPLRPLCSLWLNVFSAPAHERAPPAPAVHLRSSREETLISLFGRQRIEFSTGFLVRNLRTLRTFLVTFENRQTVSAKSSWFHYILRMGLKENRVKEY